MSSKGGSWNIERQKAALAMSVEGRYKRKEGDVKCVVLGDGGVGKTCMLMTYATNEFPPDYVPTVFDNDTYDHQFNGKTIKLSLWDTGGGEEYDRIRSLSYPFTDVFLICFSFVNLDSVDHVKTKWVPEVKYHCPGIPFLIIGLKDDLRGDMFWSNESNINRLIHGYLRNDECINYGDIPLDIFGVIEMYLFMENKCMNEVVCDEEAERLCGELGGDKYLSCSSFENRGLNEIFDQVCISAQKLQEKWNSWSKTKNDKNCIVL